MASSAPIDFASGNHYSVLGVSQNATEAELAKAYKMLALRYHPDKNQANTKDAEIGFKRISEAYSVLRDPVKRAEYDRTGGTRSYVSYDEAEQMWRQFSEQSPQDGRLEEEAQSRRRTTVLIAMVALILLAPNLLMQLLPGLLVVMIGLVLVYRRDNAYKWAWIALGLVLVSYLLPWILRARSGFETVQGANLKGLGEAGGAVVGVPQSGEEIFMNDGQFWRRADPANRHTGERSAREGWQQRLLKDMTTAIATGQEQVLTVFSRQGCPWCERQLPVLQRAIAQRSTQPEAPPAPPPPAVADAPQQAPEEAPTAPPAAPAPAPAAPAPTPAPEPATAFLAPAAVGMAQPPMGASLMSAPLRVFILYAEEFPSVAQAFNVEAFPTLIAWGLPGVPPLAAQGFLDNENLDRLLSTVASSQPEVEQG